MRLKLITTLSLIMGLGMLVGWPWLLPSPRKGASRAEVRTYTVQSTAYLGGLLVVLVTAATGSYLVMKQARESYVEESRENFRALVEGTLQDHQRGGKTE